ncbi:MAG TPA: hypothetical protein VGW40_06995 [Allosphingosinicella sp.]|nr:hypothetical protein [Allosphingosinicella sp.]
MKRSGLFAAAALMSCAAMPAQATMGCWNSTQVAAAKVRDLQSRLMVATLRCQAMGADVTEAYNRFVRANRTTIQGANAVLLAQFRSGYGSQAQTHYDRFATALANIYGADATDHGICADTAALAEEAAAANGDIGQLVAIEDRFGFSSDLPGGQCGYSFASAEDGN